MNIGETTFGCDLKSGMSRYVSNLITQFAKIAGDAAVLFDPLEVESIADGMLVILGSAENSKVLADRGRERASEFSWEKTARKTLEVIRNVA